MVFSGPTHYAAAAVHNLAAGKLTASGGSDIVTADGGNASVTVYISAPSGVFGSGQTIQLAAPGSASTTAVTIGDVNGDGSNDIVAAAGCAIYVLIGNGDGTFRSPILSPTPHGCDVEFLALGRLGMHSAVDLVTADGPAPGADPSTVSTLKGDGSGTFTKIGTYGVGSTYDIAWTVRVADLNADGNLDVAVGMWNVTKILFGYSDGALAPAVDLGAPPDYPSTYGAGPGKMTVADVNGDGAPDIITVSQKGIWDNTAAIGVRLGHPDGTFDDWRVTPTTAGALTLTAADFNGDGNTDLAIVSGPAIAPGYAPSVVSVHAGDGTGSFSTPPVTYPLSQQKEADPVTYGDFNRDGRQDLAVADRAGGFDVFLNTSPVSPLTAQFNWVVDFVGTGTTRVKVAFDACASQGASSFTWQVAGSAPVETRNCHNFPLYLPTGSSDVTLTVHGPDGFNVASRSETVTLNPYPAFNYRVYASTGRLTQVHFDACGSSGVATYMWMIDGKAVFSSSSCGDFTANLSPGDHQVFLRGTDITGFVQTDSQPKIVKVPGSSPRDQDCDIFSATSNACWRTGLLWFADTFKTPTRPPDFALLSVTGGPPSLFPLGWGAGAASIVTCDGDHFISPQVEGSAGLFLTIIAGFGYVGDPTGRAPTNGEIDSFVSGTTYELGAGSPEGGTPAGIASNVVTNDGYNDGTFYIYSPGAAGPKVGVIYARGILYSASISKGFSVESPFLGWTRPSPDSPCIGGVTGQPWWKKLTLWAGGGGR